MINPCIPGAQLAFNGVGPLPMAAIKRARADLEGALDSSVAAHQRRLEELCAASQASNSQLQAQPVG